MLLKPLRWIVFDITGTLLTFHPSVAHIYYKMANKVEIPFALKNAPQEGEQLFKNALSTAFRQVNQDYPCYGYQILISEREWWKKIVRSTLNTAFDQAGGGLLLEGGGKSTLSDEDHDRYFRAVYQAFGAESSYLVYPDTREFLEAVSGCVRKRTYAEEVEGSPFHPPFYQLGIITNSDVRSIDTTLPVVGLHHYFRFGISSTDYGFMKPDPRQFHQALQEMTYYDKGLRKHEEVLYIGNDLHVDYYGAKQFGFQSVLISK